MTITAATATVRARVPLAGTRVVCVVPTGLVCITSCNCKTAAQQYYSFFYLAGPLAGIAVGRGSGQIPASSLCTSVQIAMS